MRDGHDAAAIESGHDARLNQRQSGGVRVYVIQMDALLRSATVAVFRRRPSNPLHLAVPQRLARQRARLCIEQGELDA